MNVENEELSGSVERVTFHNEDTGFAVLRVLVKGHREPVTVLGKLPAVSPGEHLVARGAWIMDRTHGRQFQAEMLRTTPPDSLEGIEKFLGSGLIQGIGPVYAKILIKEKNAAILQANCVECHDDLTHGMGVEAEEPQQAVSCVHCHARVGHGPRGGLGGPLKLSERSGERP